MGCARILTSDFKFRGSLGDEKIGHNGFINYVEKVHLSLGDYKCHIEDLVSEPGKVFAKMLFGGVHRAIFFGYEPTNKYVSWNGCALFTFCDNRISELWVLGDLYGLTQNLDVNKKTLS